MFLSFVIENNSPSLLLLQSSSEQSLKMPCDFSARAALVEECDDTYHLSVLNAATKMIVDIIVEINENIRSCVNLMTSTCT